MNYSEMLEALKKCRKVFVWFVYSEDGGHYIKVSKALMLNSFEGKHYTDILFKCHLDDNCLYFN